MMIRQSPKSFQNTNNNNDSPTKRILNSAPALFPDLILKENIGSGASNKYEKIRLNDINMGGNDTQPANP